jgi:Putative motility protein
MDMGLVMAAMMQKAAALQQQISTSVLKTNLDAQKSNVLTLLDSAQQSLSLANVGSGVGGNLNVSA